MLFFEKGAKKLLTFGRRARSRNEASSGISAGAKVFCFFFLKKKALLLWLTPSIGARTAAN
jgi:hypothetical protein